MTDHPSTSERPAGADFVVVVAVQDAGRAKSRLGPDLDPGTRRTLVIAMLDDLLTTVREVWTKQIVIVSPDHFYDPVAHEHTAEVIRDAGTGFNDAVLLALSRVSDAEAALVLPGDLPHISTAEVATLLNSLSEPGVTIVRADDGGTLALGLRPTTAIVPRFGPGSADAHAEAARLAGIPYSVARVGNLRHDIDTLDDLARAWEHVGEATTALLEHLSLPVRAAPRD